MSYDLTENELAIQDAVRMVWFIVTLLIVIGVGYDFLTFANDVPQYIDSISGVVKRGGWAFPAFPFAYFGLGAHFWWNVDQRIIPHPWNYWLLGGVHVLWAGLSWAVYNFGVFMPGGIAWMIVSTFAGIGAWVLLFPQRPQQHDFYWHWKRGKK